MAGRALLAGYHRYKDSHCKDKTFSWPLICMTGMFYCLGNNPFFWGCPIFILAIKCKPLFPLRYPILPVDFSAQFKIQKFKIKKIPNTFTWYSNPLFCVEQQWTEKVIRERCCLLAEYGTKWHHFSPRQNSSVYLGGIYHIVCISLQKLYHSCCSESFSFCI